VLFYAVYAGQHSIVEYLCKKAGCNTNLVDQYGKTALHVACKNGNLESVRFLVEGGSQVNFLASHPRDSWTPLMYASFHGWIDIVKYLLEMGADPSILTIHGKTAAELARDPLVRDTIISFKSSSSVDPAPPPRVDIFVSCDQSDYALAEKIQSDLRLAGFSPFLSCPDLLPNKHSSITSEVLLFPSLLGVSPLPFDLFLADELSFFFNQKYRQELKKAQIFVPLLSNQYSEDTHCREQVNFADECNKPIIALLTSSDTAFPPSGPMGPVLAGTLYQVNYFFPLLLRILFLPNYHS